MAMSIREGQKMIDNMKLGDLQAIKKGLSEKGAIYRMNAIIFSVVHNVTSSDVLTKISDLVSDNVLISGYTVGDVASAALDVLGVKAYSGNKHTVQCLIQSRFDFWS